MSFDDVFRGIGDILQLPYKMAYYIGDPMGESYGKKLLYAEKVKEAQAEAALAKQKALLSAPLANAVQQLLIDTSDHTDPNYVKNSIDYANNKAPLNDSLNPKHKAFSQLLADNPQLDASLQFGLKTGQIKPTFAFNSALKTDPLSSNFSFNPTGQSYQYAKTGETYQPGEQQLGNIVAGAPKVVIQPVQPTQQPAPQPVAPAPQPIDYAANLPETWHSKDGETKLDGMQPNFTNSMGALNMDLKGRFPDKKIVITGAAEQSGHTNDSDHYQGRAWDIGGDDLNDPEYRAIVINEAKARGYKVRDEGDHLHLYGNPDDPAVQQPASQPTAVSQEQPAFKTTLQPTSQLQFRNIFDNSLPQNARSSVPGMSMQAALLRNPMAVAALPNLSDEQRSLLLLDPSQRYLASLYKNNLAINPKDQATLNETIRKNSADMLHELFGDIETANKNIFENGGTAAQIQNIRKQIALREQAVGLAPGTVQFTGVPGEGLKMKNYNREMAKDADESKRGWANIGLRQFEANLKAAGLDLKQHEFAYKVKQDSKNNGLTTKDLEEGQKYLAALYDGYASADKDQKAEFRMNGEFLHNLRTQVKILHPDYNNQQIEAAISNDLNFIDGYQKQVDPNNPENKDAANQEAIKKAQQYNYDNTL